MISCLFSFHHLINFFFLFYTSFPLCFCSPGVFIRSPLQVISQFRGRHGIGSLTGEAALFGIPTSRGSFVGQLVSAPDTSDGCSSIVLSETNNVQWYKAINNPSRVPIIALLDRGSCDFVRKALNAQQAGASALIVTNLAIQGGSITIMGDDGGGEQIMIPSIAIPFDEGNLLKQSLTASRIQLEWIYSVPPADGIPLLDWWSSPLDNSSLPLKTSFYSLFQDLNGRIRVQPHFIFRSGSQLSPRCTGTEASCRDCISNGRYCFPLSDNERARGFQGSDVLHEALRQLCLANRLSLTNNLNFLFLYWKNFYSSCSGAINWKNNICSFRIIDNLGIPGVSSSLINQCMMADPDSGDQSILRDELILNKAYGRALNPNPFLLINSVHIAESPICADPRSRTSCSAIEEICMSYPPTSAPAACSASSTCPFGEILDPNCGECRLIGSEACQKQSEESSSNFAIILILIFLAVLVLVALIVIHIYRQKRRMREEVASILASYLPLDEEFNGKSVNQTTQSKIEHSLAKRLGLDSLKEKHAMEIEQSNFNHNQNRGQRAKKFKWTKLEEGEDEDEITLELSELEQNTDTAR
jgi:hypothetical protein